VAVRARLWVIFPPMPQLLSLGELPHIYCTAAESRIAKDLQRPTLIEGPGTWLTTERLRDQVSRGAASRQASSRLIGAVSKKGRASFHRVRGGPVRKDNTARIFPPNFLWLVESFLS
jgi:hypothetical protein